MSNSYDTNNEDVGVQAKKKKMIKTVSLTTTPSYQGEVLPLHDSHGYDDDDDDEDDDDDDNIVVAGYDNQVNIEGEDDDDDEALQDGKPWRFSAGS